MEKKIKIKEFEPKEFGYRTAFLNRETNTIFLSKKLRNFPKYREAVFEHEVKHSKNVSGFFLWDLLIDGSTFKNFNLEIVQEMRKCHPDSYKELSINSILYEILLPFFTLPSNIILYLQLFRLQNQEKKLKGGENP